MTGNPRIAVTGSTGLIGSALVSFFEKAGFPLRRVRRTPGDDFDPGPLHRADVVIHLAGETIAGRWSHGKKDRILRSRIDGTRSLVRTFAGLPKPPDTFLCASAVGFYGNRGDRELSENDPSGTGFLSEVCREWEAAAQEGLPASTRLVHLRFGVVLSPAGGALRKLLSPARFGLAGPLGKGGQFMSWVSIRDVVGLIDHARRNDSVRGPLNVVSPSPVTNREFVRTLTRVLRRPMGPSLPVPLLRALFGECAEETLLASTRALPRKALEHGYSFAHPVLEGTLRDLLDRNR